MDYYEIRMDLFKKSLRKCDFSENIVKPSSQYYHQKTSITTNATKHFDQ